MKLLAAIVLSMGLLFSPTSHAQQSQPTAEGKHEVKKAPKKAKKQDTTTKKSGASNSVKK